MVLKSSTLSKLLTGLVLCWTLSPLSAQSLNPDEARHLLRRASFRHSSEDTDRLLDQGIKAYLAWQMSPSAGEPGLEKYLDRLPHRGLNPKMIYLRLVEEPRATSIIEQEMQRGRLIRGLLTEHQLREVMTDFWFNHFNADPDKGAVVACNVERLEEDLRKNAFASFRTILGLAVRNPAVLENLDNTVSHGSAVNENFGRELMELYSTGPGHTQEEVVEAARCFSGWSYDENPKSDTYLQFRYYPNMHAPGRKLIFGRVFGEHEQEAALDHLATLPSTAEFISRKLVVRFVNDRPPENLVRAAKAEFLRTNGDIGKVLTLILSSEEFFNTEHRGRKMKTPLEFLISALFESGADSALYEDLASNGPMARELTRRLDAMGSPYSCPNPQGWPDLSSTWTSGHGQRQRWAVAEMLGEREGLLDRAASLIAPEFQAR